MKAIYFEASAKSAFHIHAGAYTHGVYLPQEGAVLFRELVGTFGKPQLFISEDNLVLKRLQPLLGGEAPTDLENVTYSHIKEYDLNESDIREILSDARNAKHFKEKSDAGIERILSDLEEKTK